VIHHQSRPKGSNLLLYDVLLEYSIKKLIIMATSEGWNE
jgi:hypothetical protein